MEPVKISKYSERSFVVSGLATKKHKELLMELGGRYNLNLTNPETGEKFSGWIFSIKRKQKVINDFIMNDIDYTNEID